MTFAKNKVIAHRGAWKKNNLPENSIASLKEAIRLGCEGSETDIHMTADSFLVINHDNEWGGITIQKNSLADVSTKKLSNGESLPLLKDFLSIIKQQQHTKLILEIKPSVRGREWADATVQKVVEMVQKIKVQPWIVYISFDYQILKEILNLDASANTQYLDGDKDPAQLKKDGIKGVDYHFSVFQKHPEWIQSAKKNKIDLNAWTVNDEETMHWLLQNDFDFITTNEPELLFKVVEEFAQKK
ncbi:glycerophosphodiester phosphodiesterase [Hanamia caeni]|nr:glycerophosphodiester phosphodiesterase family protein [Hanamia caeni]